MGGKTSNASITKYKAKTYDAIGLLVPKGKGLLFESVHSAKASP